MNQTRKAKTLIVEALALGKAKKGGVNVDSAKAAKRVYLSSAVVSLASMKRVNPDCDVVLATSFDVSEEHAAHLRALGVGSEVVPFDDFVYPDEVEWGLAYYKLRVLDWASQLGYETVVLCDTDVWCQRPLSPLVEESRGGVMLLDLDSSVESSDRQAMVCDARRLGLDARLARCWGGELIAGSADALRSLVDRLHAVYEQTLSEGVFSRRGDEFLLFCALADPSVRMLPANAYVQRVWTGRHFTPIRHEDYCALHLPAEKNHAFAKAYVHLSRHGRVPLNERFLLWCGLKPSRRPFSPLWVCERCASKVRSALER